MGQLIEITEHAQERLDQRGFYRSDVDLIMEYGDTRTCRDGGTSYFFTKQAKRRLRREMGARDASAHLSKLSKTYVVMSKNKMLTIANSNHSNKWEG